MVSIGDVVLISSPGAAGDLLVSDIWVLGSVSAYKVAVVLFVFFSDHNLRVVRSPSRRSIGDVPLRV